MNKNIFLRQWLVFFLLVFFATGALSYGGGGGEASKCKKPAFKDLSPPQSSVVSPGTGFSFTASANTNPASIKVEVMGHEVDLGIKKNGNIKVSGNLPSELTEGYARINILARSSGRCEMRDGWLLKIGK